MQKSCHNSRNTKKVGEYVELRDGKGHYIHGALTTTIHILLDSGAGHEVLIRVKQGGNEDHLPGSQDPTTSLPRGQGTVWSTAMVLSKEERSIRPAVQRQN